MKACVWRLSVAGTSITARYQRMASERRSELAIKMNPMTRSQLIDVLLLEREGMGKVERSRGAL
jgi:hypothetical protein